MPIFLVILSALEGLLGPMAELVKAMFTAWQDFHTNGDTTPEQLLIHAGQLYASVKALTSDVDTQIVLISQALQESHHDLTPAIAHTIAAGVVNKG